MNAEQKEINLMLIELIEIFPDFITKEGKHFMQHDEYALAFESICYAIVEENYSLSREAFMKLLHLSKKLDTDSDIILKIEKMI